jgi:hypothetical protein
MAAASVHEPLQENQCRVFTSWEVGELIGCVYIDASGIHQVISPSD